MKKRMSLLGLPLAAGLALVLVAITSWGLGPTAHAQATDTPTATNTPLPTATATPNPSCILDVSKNDNTSEVAEGGQITYTIKVSNDASSGSCNNLDVTDTIPDDTDCVTATVTDDDRAQFRYPRRLRHVG